MYVLDTLVINRNVRLTLTKPRRIRHVLSNLFYSARYHMYDFRENEAGQILDPCKGHNLPNQFAFNFGSIG